MDDLVILLPITPLVNPNKSLMLYFNPMQNHVLESIIPHYSSVCFDQEVMHTLNDTSFFSFDNVSALITAIYQVIFEGVYALHPDIRKSLDLWIAVVRYPGSPYLRCSSLKSHFNLLI